MPFHVPEESFLSASRKLLLLIAHTGFVVFDSSVLGLVFQYSSKRSPLLSNEIEATVLNGGAFYTCSFLKVWWDGLSLFTSPIRFLTSPGLEKEVKRAFLGTRPGMRKVLSVRFLP